MQSSSSKKKTTKKYEKKWRPNITALKEKLTNGGKDYKEVIAEQKKSGKKEN